ncbi:hypothetical protein U1Q18_034280 [Sarracenia purpurea var. burkii]
MEDIVAEVVKGCVSEAAEVSRPDEERDSNMEDTEAEDGESGAVDNEGDIANQGGLPLSCPLYGNGLETGKECEIKKNSFPPLFRHMTKWSIWVKRVPWEIRWKACSNRLRLPKDGVGMKQPGVNRLVPGLAHKVFVDTTLKNMDPGMSEDKDVRVDSSETKALSEEESDEDEVCKAKVSELEDDPKSSGYPQRP